MKRRAANPGRFIYLDQTGPVVDLAYYWHFKQGAEYWYRNPVHGLSLIEKGTIEYDMPDGVVRGKAGDLIYCRPMPRGHYRVRTPANVFVVGLRFAPPPLHLHTPCLFGAGPLPVRLPMGTAFEEMRSLMETVCLEVPRRGVEHRLNVKGAIYQMLGLLARVIRHKPPAGMKMDAWEHIRIQLGSVGYHKLRIADLAHEMDVSVQYFQREFRRRFQISPKAYQLRSRINEAARRLRESDVLFKVVAYEMGFHDPKILAHAIRRHLGVGPSELRRMPSAKLRDRMPEVTPLFQINRHLVPPETPANWHDKFEPKSGKLRRKNVS